MKTYDINTIPEEAREAWMNYINAVNAKDSAQCGEEEDWDDFDKRYKALEDAEKEARHNIIPWVGMGCTEILWSDRRAHTVTDVIRNKSGKITGVKVRENKTICKDWYGNEYEILPEIDWTSREEIYTKRRNGMWYMKGQPTEWGSVWLSLTSHYHSIDPCF